MNYTPFDVASFKKKKEVQQPSNKSFDINAIFLTLIVITLVVMTVLLYILIQKKLQELAYIPFFA
ncbi:MAG: hypothetical protein V1922_04040 [bacterium]